MASWMRSCLPLILALALTNKLAAQNKDRSAAPGRDPAGSKAASSDDRDPVDLNDPMDDEDSTATNRSGSDETRPAPAPKRQPSKPIGSAMLRPGLARAGNEPPAAVIREPSQGRPIFITPDETFYFVMRLPPDIEGDVTFSLVHALEPAKRISLIPTTPPSYVNDEYCTLVLKIPARVEPGLYDIEVKAKTGRHVARHCVKVVDNYRTRFRFVHLSDMNIGDLTAPEFDDMLPNEINLLAPEFIIATGDYTEWARARNDASSWQRVLGFFEKFDAPVFMLCGVTDDEDSFTRYVASKPIGTVDYGQYHGLLLLDHAANPIDQDFSQLQWVDADLKRNRNRMFNFIATNSDELSLLDIWKERGDLPSFIREHKVKMFIVGGATDWDYKEFSNKIAGLDDFHLIRTHESSTCLRDRATGFSHYRVIEVDGDKIDYVYPDDNAVARLEHSIPTGRLRAFFEGPNNGSQDRVGVTIQNALNQSYDDASIWLRVAKSGDREPKVAPGRIEQMMDMGDYWACRVRCDLPDKGAVRIVASTDPSVIPAPVPVAVTLNGPGKWTFSEKSTDFGLTYFHSDDAATISLANHSDSPVSCWPVIRVNGTKLAPDRSVCPRMPISLEPRQTLTVPLVLNLRRVSPGSHKLQVFFLDDPLSRLTTFDVTLANQAPARSARAD